MRAIVFFKQRTLCEIRKDGAVQKTCPCAFALSFTSCRY